MHYGKTTTDPDWHRRARPCVFVGWSTSSPSYRLYDLDARDIVEAAETHVTFQVDNFPMLSHKLHGETLPGDLALNIDGWRSTSDTALHDATDHVLAQWLAGKQICITLANGVGGNGSQIGEAFRRSKTA